MILNFWCWEFIFQRFLHDVRLKALSLVFIVVSDNFWVLDPRHFILFYQENRYKIFRYKSVVIFSGRPQGKSMNQSHFLPVAGISESLVESNASKNVWHLQDLIESYFWHLPPFYGIPRIYEKPSLTFPYIQIAYSSQQKMNPKYSSIHINESKDWSNLIFISAPFLKKRLFWIW